MNTLHEICPEAQTETHAILIHLSDGERRSAKQIYERSELIESRQDANKCLWEMRQRGYVESAPATGDISDPAARLVWSITEAGRAYLAGTPIDEPDAGDNIPPDATAPTRKPKAKAAPKPKTKTAAIISVPDSKTCQCGGGCSRHGNPSGAKYFRDIHLVDGKADVYAVLVAFGVSCPARQHAIKKLLCAGLCGNCDEAQDLAEARDAIERAMQMQSER